MEWLEARIRNAGLSVSFGFTLDSDRSPYFVVNCPGWVTAYSEVIFR